MNKRHLWVWLGMFLLLVSCKEEDSKMIVCWGDSLTAPHTGGSWKSKIKKLLMGDNSYPAVLQSSLGNGYKIVNAGVGGENTLTIMARQGAFPMELAHDVVIYKDEYKEYDKFLGNKDVPAFRSSYNGKTITPLLQCGWKEEGPAKVNPSRIGGKEYMIESESHHWREGGKSIFEYNYFINPNVGTERTDTLKEGSVIQTYAMRHLRGVYANVFFMGQNGGFEDIADLIRQYKAMVAYSQSNKYIIVGYHAPNMITPNVQRMQEMEDSLQQVFGGHYINLRSYMVDNGLKDASLHPTQADLDSMAKGKVPPQLIPDGCHFTSEGYHLLAGLIENRMRLLGYID